MNLVEDCTTLAHGRRDFSIDIGDCSVSVGVLNAAAILPSATVINVVLQIIQMLAKYQYHDNNSLHKLTLVQPFDLP